MDVRESIAKRQDRANQLYDLGLRYDSYLEFYIKGDIRVHWMNTDTMDDIEWNKLIADIKKKLPDDNTDPYCISQIA